MSIIRPKLEIVTTQTAVLILAAFASIIPTTAFGLANQPLPIATPQLVVEPGDPIGPVVPPFFCQPRSGVKGVTHFSGIALVGLTMNLSADHIKLFNQDPLCDSVYQALSVGDYSWSLAEQPMGSTTNLEGTDTLHPTFFVDAQGTYKIVLTVCPDTCSFGTLTVPATEKITTFETTEFLRPERHPVAPASVRGSASCDLGTGTCQDSSIPCDSDFQCASFNQPLFASDLTDIKCQFGGGVTDPQWVTVQEFAGVQHYAGYHGGIVNAVEGVIRQARISSMDNEFNHHSQDANWNVQLDGIFGHMKTGSGLSMHNEWETNEVNGAFQPSTTDRVSMWGYLIHDCGHGGFKTEIHPPVGLAVHRERAVQIPSGWTSPDLPDQFGAPSSPGTGVQVPGIVTDVWFNRDAGEMVEGDRTGLHQPGQFLPSNCQAGSSGCISFRGESGFVVGGSAIEGLAPINGLFRFRVHLPRSPQAVLERAGVNNIPPTPLYYEVFPGNIPASRVDAQVITEATGTSEPDVTFLLVTVDLTGAVGTIRPWFRMAAAWVYPDPANWDLQKRRVTIRKLHVTNEGDGFLRGSGDWRLWAQLNNSSFTAPLLTNGFPRQEWTRIVNGSVDDGCDFFSLGCGKDHTFSGEPWSTSNPSANRSLGPDVLVYPDQPVWLHLSGFEGDWFGGDSLGVINELHYRAFDTAGSAPGEEPVSNACQEPDIDFIPGDLVEGALPTNAGCARFSVHYKVENLGPVAPAVLSSAANKFRDRYRLRATDCNDDVGSCFDRPYIDPAAVLAPEPPSVLHPLEELILPGNELPSIFAHELYEKRETEEYVLNSLNVPNLRTKIEFDLENEPEVAAEFLAELRGNFEGARAEFGDEVLLDLQLLKLAIPAAQFEQYFGDLPEPTPMPGITTRNMRGAGRIGSGRDGTEINLALNCDPIRAPNNLTISWKDDPYNHRRFELDLMLQVACNTDGDPMKSHAGRGLGRGERCCRLSCRMDLARQRQRQPRF